MTDRRWRILFYLAAAYNAAWGIFVSLAPNALFSWLNMPVPNYPAFFQCIGMFVGLYAYGYFLIARDPERFGPFVYIGLSGKILGPVGFVFYALQHKLPWQFGALNIFNDVIWLPLFVAFTVKVYRRERELRYKGSSQFGRVK